jgi:hypothetical protein
MNSIRDIFFHGAGGVFVHNKAGHAWFRYAFGYSTTKRDLRYVTISN